MLSLQVIPGRKAGLAVLGYHKMVSYGKEQLQKGKGDGCSACI